VTAPRFSSRTEWSREHNRLTEALLARRARGGEILDLTESNPTRCGLVVEGERIRKALDREAVLHYDPLPRGSLAAREEVAALYAGMGTGLSAERIVLTASTSEAYGWLFRLLAEPGDEILVPVPSYPLFEFLARLNDVVLRPYPLIEDENFRVDIDALREAAGPRTRAVLAVSPGNPTGVFLTSDELEAIDALGAERGLALIADEVFADYGAGDDPFRARTAARPGARALTFSLNGLSKMLALPQMKLGWIAASGPEALVTEALERLEVIADTYLSVNTPVQAALGDLLALRPAIQKRVRARLDANRAAASVFAPPHPARVLPSQGGWSIILRVPATRHDEEWALLLLEEDGVLVQPGYFYDFPSEGRLVLSLLPEERIFSEAVSRIAARIER